MKRTERKRNKTLVLLWKIHKILVCKTNEKLNEYVNRDINSVKNMKNIVFSYINTNYKPKTHNKTLVLFRLRSVRFTHDIILVLYGQFYNCE